MFRVQHVQLISCEVRLKLIFNLLFAAMIASMNLAIFALHINEMFFMCNADFHISDFLVLSLVVSRLALWSQHAIDQMCAIAISLNHNRHSGRRKAKFRKAKFIGGRRYACRKKRSTAKKRFFSMCRTMLTCFVQLASLWHHTT